MPNVLRIQPLASVFDFLDRVNCLCTALLQLSQLKSRLRQRLSKLSFQCLSLLRFNRQGFCFCS